MPGYSNFYYGVGGGTITEGVDLAVAAVRTAFNAIAGYLPTSVLINVDPEVAMFSDVSGELEDVYTSTTVPAVVTGQGGGPYSAASGASITWLTTAIRDGRRLRGRTYLVPLSTLAYDAAGTLVPNALTALAAFGTALRTPGGSAGPFRVFGRPSPEHPVGMSAPVTQAIVRDRVSILTSRRD